MEKEKKPKKGSTALIDFAKWLRDVPKDTIIQVTKSKKTIVFIRQDIK